MAFHDLIADRSRRGGNANGHLVRSVADGHASARATTVDLVYAVGIHWEDVRRTAQENGQLKRQGRVVGRAPAETERETVKCIEALGEGGGCICGPDRHIKPDISPENALALFDTALSFRRAGYTCQGGSSDTHG